MSRVRTGEAPGKIILFGEHAVVYGEPAVALPLSRTVSVRLRDGTGQIDVRPAAPGPSTHAASPRALVARALAAALDTTDVRIRFDVPPMAGFGSSAALAVALLRAAGGRRSRPALLTRALEIEAVAHGRPSGVDPAVAIWETPITFVRDGGPPKVRRLRIRSPFWLVVGSAGRHGGTARVVARIAALRKAAPPLVGAAMQTLGEASRAGARSLTRGQLPACGQALRLAHGVLGGLGLVGPEVADAVHHLEAHGALGAKMSGAGGDGGAFLGLFDGARQANRAARALRRAGPIAWVERYDPFPSAPGPR